MLCHRAGQHIKPLHDIRVPDDQDRLPPENPISLTQPACAA